MGSIVLVFTFGHTNKPDINNFLFSFIQLALVMHGKYIETKEGNCSKKDQINP